jgi:hypothetical protein
MMKCRDWDELDMWLGWGKTRKCPLRKQRNGWKDSTKTDLEDVILVTCKVDGSDSASRCDMSGFCISGVELSGYGKVGLLTSCSRRWYARGCLQSYDVLRKFHGNAPLASSYAKRHTDIQTWLHFSVMFPYRIVKLCLKLSLRQCKPEFI